MADNLGLFDTPMLRYLSMKRIFLEKFLDPKVWRGEFGSKEQIIALDGVLTYFQKTSNLAEEFPQLINDVVTENKNLIMQRILPMPLKLYSSFSLNSLKMMRGTIAAISSKQAVRPWAESSTLLRRERPVLLLCINTRFGKMSTALRNIHLSRFVMVTLLLMVTLILMVNLIVMVSLLVMFALLVLITLIVMVTLLEMVTLLVMVMVTLLVLLSLERVSSSPGL